MVEPSQTSMRQCSSFSVRKSYAMQSERRRTRPTLRDPNRKNHYSKNNYKKMRQMSEQARDKNA